eukprot:GILJ01008066.1.p1 GENE.GILJ01008066.1~~GILJ01008066.1.p1  ORF type:complete len:340 (+),score=34.03 GILJ01008066.1:1-1020(+)
MGCSVCPIHGVVLVALRLSCCCSVRVRLSVSDSNMSTATLQLPSIHKRGSVTSISNDTPEWFHVPAAPVLHTSPSYVLNERFNASNLSLSKPPVPLERKRCKSPDVLTVFNPLEHEYTAYSSPKSEPPSPAFSDRYRATVQNNQDAFHRTRSQFANFTVQLEQTKFLLPFYPTQSRDDPARLAAAEREQNERRHELNESFRQDMERRASQAQFSRLHHSASLQTLRHKSRSVTPTGGARGAGISRMHSSSMSKLVRSGTPSCPASSSYLSSTSPQISRLPDEARDTYAAIDDFDKRVTMMRDMSRFRDRHRVASDAALSSFGRLSGRFDLNDQYPSSYY